MVKTLASLVLLVLVVAVIHFSPGAEDDDTDFLFMRVKSLLNASDNRIGSCEVAVYEQDGKPIFEITDGEALMYFTVREEFFTFEKEEVGHESNEKKPLTQFRAIDDRNGTSLRFKANGFHYVSTLFTGDDSHREINFFYNKETGSVDGLWYRLNDKGQHDGINDYTCGDVPVGVYGIVTFHPGKFDYRDTWDDSKAKIQSAAGLVKISP